MGVLHIKDANGKFIQIPAIAGKSAYEIAVSKGVFSGSEQEFAEELMGKKTLKEVNVSDNILQLTTDRYQIAEIVNNVEIKLPTVEEFVEIHLYFSTTDIVALTLPEGKYQVAPEFQANKTYEFIFTYIGEWLIGYVEYGANE